MAEATSIFEGLKYLYAEELKGQKVTLTIAKIEGGKPFTTQSGKTEKGFDITFKETRKNGDPLILGLVGVTVRRQLDHATGTSNPQEMIGKKIVLYPADSIHATNKIAIRIAKFEGPPN